MAVVTTGFFDGVHLGHRHILSQLVAEARVRGEESVVVTFWPHPRTVLQQDARDLRLLTSLQEKTELIKSLGVSRVEVLPFTRSFAAMTASEYLSMLRERFGATLVMMGYDNRIGSDRRTAVDLVESVLSSKPSLRSSLPPSDSVGGPLPEIKLLSEFVVGQGEMPDRGGRDGMAVAGPSSVISSGAEGRVEKSLSSTQIRKALMAGEIDQANKMLGYCYGLHGVVVAGNQLGRTIGFPTANMKLYEPLKLIPANGVYAVDVQVLGQNYKGMCNIGVRPTVDRSGGLTIETNIFDFDEDIYGLDMTLTFRRRIRSERRFDSLEDLKLQLHQDALACR